ncbi:MAG: hypothetical protein ACXWQO_03495 [Bdellovibrionota bacterium]
MKFTTTLIAPLLLATVLAQAAEQPKYLGAAPKSFCLSGEIVASKVKSCEDNSVFLKAAQKCFADFKALRTSTAADLGKRYGKDHDAQKQDFANHAADNKEAIAAHSYLISLGETAVKELDDYFDWIEHPEDAMTDQEIMDEPCFMENASALDKLVNDFEDEVNAMKSAKAIETAHSATSAKNMKQIDAGSVNAPIKSNSGQGSASIKGHTIGKDSDVSGIEESKKKLDAEKKVIK